MNIAGSQMRQRSRQIMNLVTLMGQLLAAFRASHRRVLLRRLQGKASDASDARRCPRTPLLTLSAGPYLGRGEPRSPSRCQRAGSSRTAPDVPKGRVLLQAARSQRLRWPPASRFSALPSWNPRDRRMVGQQRTVFGHRAVRHLRVRPVLRLVPRRDALRPSPIWAARH
jgi:hypothetical protein